MHTLRFPLLVVFLLAPACVFSQTPSAAVSSDSINPPASSSTPAYRELSFYAGQTFGYPILMSDLKDQRLFVLGARFTGYLYRFRHLNLNGNVDLKPLALYSNDVYGPRQYTYGGAVEIGLQFVPHTHWRFQPFVDVDGGTAMFGKNTPTVDTRRVNYCLEFGPGFYIPISKHQSIKSGVSYFHFSNGYTVAHNPGFDSFLVYLAFSFHNLHPSHHSKPS
jgi:Lipid A 3-O-deacylase (PagL)